MTIRKILTEPDPFLRQKSENVEVVSDEIRLLMNDMLETMYIAPGIGLAAIQIGVPKRVIVIDLMREGEKKIHYILLTQRSLPILRLMFLTKKGVFLCQDNLQK